MVEDKLVWHYDKQGEYTVKSGYWVSKDKDENASSAALDKHRKLEVKSFAANVLWNIWKMRNECLFEEGEVRPHISIARSKIEAQLMSGNGGGQKGGSNPSAMLATLLGKREKLQNELRGIEKQVYELETSYLQDVGHFGNVLKGFEGFLSSSKATTNLKRSRKFQQEDRLFSLSSVTSPADKEDAEGGSGARRRMDIVTTSHHDLQLLKMSEEFGAGRDDGRSEFGAGRSRGGAVPATVQGKPKKGRTPIAPRDVKRIRPSSEAEIDEEDDPDMSLR
ncbi:hypothetical protein Tsubulata_001205 [Turnera subulata]|uniref:Chromatin modification-related protein EAF6 n=1 Tax=Turnera subulata TaxID=218843 RepID=A0A9Q0F6A2_9ROSI|nr:hypothetical protein Tsubulata_001205 [Turnera subulata]